MDLSLLVQDPVFQVFFLVFFIVIAVIVLKKTSRGLY